MSYKLKRMDNKVIFTLEDEEYRLSSHPYEPCLYIYKNDEMIKIIHNAFDVDDLIEMFEASETVVAADSEQFDEEAFCKVLDVAINDEHYEMNWTFAAKLVKD